MTKKLDFIQPDWPAPKVVRALTTTRAGGFSQGNYAALNLADNVEDISLNVERNRNYLLKKLNLLKDPSWLRQVHSSRVVCADDVNSQTEADASWTSQAGLSCVILTADCLPVLFCDKNAEIVAAAHVGWRGMHAGILENTLSIFTMAGILPSNVMVWLGPSISSNYYEIDSSVRDVFIATDPSCSYLFKPTRKGHWNFNLFKMASRILYLSGVGSITGGNYCTYLDQRFFSYRRDNLCGRQATMIWLDS
ncbi:MAG: peptidoglycan editing factor PgeF [Pseudomonadota bacterium]|nr:peptidoglycan editing factor PgeF [Pseudomonadota bacterium]